MTSSGPSGPADRRAGYVPAPRPDHDRVRRRPRPPRDRFHGRLSRDLPRALLGRGGHAPRWAPRRSLLQGPSRREAGGLRPRPLHVAHLDGFGCGPDAGAGFGGSIRVAFGAHRNSMCDRPGTGRHAVRCCWVGAGLRTQTSDSTSDSRFRGVRSAAVRSEAREYTMSFTLCTSDSNPCLCVP